MKEMNERLEGATIVAKANSVYDAMGAIQGWTPCPTHALNCIY
jgi:hypothetical protein